MSKRHSNPSILTHLAHLRTLERKMHFAKLEKDKLSRQIQEINTAENSLNEAKSKADTGLISPEEFTNVLIGEGIESIERFSSLKSGEVTPAINHANKINKDIKLIFKNFTKARDYKVLMEALSRCIEKLNSLNKTATNAQDISSIRKIDDILSNAYWLLTGEANLQYDKSKYGAKRIFEILNWIINKIDADPVFEVIQKINYQALKSLEKLSSDSARKWHELLLWIDKVKCIYPFSEQENIVHLQNVSELCKERFTCYDSFSVQSASILTRITNSISYINSFNFHYIDNVREGILLLKSEESYKEEDLIIDAKYIIYLKDQYIPFYQKLIQQFRGLSDAALSTIPYLQEFTDSCMLLTKKNIDIIQNFKTNDKEESELVSQVKRKLLAIYDELSKTHKISKPLQYCVKEIYNNLKIISQYYEIQDSDRKKTIRNFIPHLRNALVAMQNTEVAITIKKIQLILDFIESRLNGKNIEKVNYPENLTGFDFDSHVKQICNSLKENANRFDTVSNLGISYGVATKDAEKQIQKSGYKNVSSQEKLNNIQFRLFALRQTKNITNYENKADLEAALEADYLAVVVPT